MLSVSGLPRYEAYKDSGYEWIGEVPEEWEVSKLRSCLSPVSIKGYPDLPLLSITREQGVIRRDIEDQDSNHNFIPDDLSGYKLLKKGQFGMNKMKAWQGSYGVSKYTGIVSPAYFIFDFTKAIWADFFNWAIRSNLYVSYFGSASDGVRVGQWDLSKDRMKAIPFVVPHKDEQKKIAKFLDKKTTQIDEAIAIKEQQIALLKERKQIIIQKAITQGLDPNVPMKNSGVDWIGEIPAHWDIVPNKKIFSLKKNLVGKKSDQYELLSLTLRGVIKRDMENPEGKFPAEFDTYQKVRAGDFVFCLFDVEETPRAVGLSSHDGMITGAYTVFGADSAVSKEFLYLFYLNLDSRKMLRPLYRGLRNTIPKDAFLSFKTPLPSLREQKEIVRFVGVEISRTELGMAHMAEQIAKLKEYKATLINAAVTGKIKTTPDMVEG